MTNTDISRWLAASGLLVSLSACVSLNPQPGTPVANSGYQESITKYTVQPGDRLSDIALEMTGSASQWQQIASFNGITDPRSLRAGATIEIPSELLLSANAEDPLAPNNSEPGATGAAGGESLAAIDSRAQGEPTGRAVPEPADTAGEVVITAAGTDRDFALQPLASPQNEAPEPRQQVQVIGTYYPKGIYARPSDASLLLMRVAPGTRFESDGQIDSWYRIFLEEGVGDGVGYVRASDARKLPAGPSL